MSSIMSASQLSPHDAQALETAAEFIPGLLRSHSAVCLTKHNGSGHSPMLRTLDLCCCSTYAGRLYFVGLESRPGDLGLGDTALRHIFFGDNTLEYVPFRSDFGPVNIAKVHRFCRILAEKLQVWWIYTTQSFCRRLLQGNTAHR